MYFYILTDMHLAFLEYTIYISVVDALTKAALPEPSSALISKHIAMNTGIAPSSLVKL